MPTSAYEMKNWVVTSGEKVWRKCDILALSICLYNGLSVTPYVKKKTLFSKKNVNRDVPQQSASVVRLF